MGFFLLLGFQNEHQQLLIKIMHIIRILYNAHISCTGRVLKFIIFLQMNDLNRSILFGAWKLEEIIKLRNR